MFVGVLWIYCGCIVGMFVDVLLMGIPTLLSLDTVRVRFVPAARTCLPKTEEAIFFWLRNRLSLWPWLSNITNHNLGIFSCAKLTRSVLSSVTSIVSSSWVTLLLLMSLFPLWLAFRSWETMKHETVVDNNLLSWGVCATSCPFSSEFMWIIICTRDHVIVPAGLETCL